MNFECPSCKKAGQVDDSKIPEAGVYATCHQCNNKFLIKREAPKDFEFEPVEQPIPTVTNIIPPVKPQQSPPTPQDTASRDNSSTTSLKQETMQQTNNSANRKQLYQAAVGKNVDYYLPIFERFDRDGA